MKTIKSQIKSILMYPHEVYTLKKSDLFDPDYYLSHNKDVAATRVPPIRHFLRHGAEERRNPSEKFNVAYYLKQNPDVRASGINPLYHYIRYGKAEGRKPILLPDFAPLSTAVLASNHSSTLIFDHNGGGGTWVYTYNNLVGAAAANEKAQILLARFVDADKAFSVEVHRKSKLTEKALYRNEHELFDDMNSVRLSTIIVNSIVSWPSAKKVLAWVEAYKKATPNVKVVFKCHDYYCICPSYTLQDYTDRFCNVRCDETGCHDCIRRCSRMHAWPDTDNAKDFSVTSWRKLWEDFFETTADIIEVFSPSSEKIFHQAYPFADGKVSVVPHKVPTFECYRIAIVGHLLVQKGSEVIRKFCEYLDMYQISDMKLYLFGENPAKVFSSHLKEMGAYERIDLPEKLKQEKIDMIFIPSTCPETFCYTAGESIALGYPTACFDLGGQADQVRESNSGIILYSDEPSYLYTTFKSVCENITHAPEADTPAASDAQTRTVVIQDTTSRDFLKWMYQQREDKSHFVPEAEDSIVLNEKMPKIIAAYLPQFHDFPENIRWFGKGFSEWTNTSQTLPQFIGHHQPHVPIDMGYYNLNNTDAMHRQAELARKYGIGGFCVYYYWFSGAKLMDQPLKRLLEDKELDFPFFLFWANDNWTMCWGNGATSETLYKSEMLPGDAEKFMDDALPYMRDHRYIKINNKPVMLIYKVALVAYENYLNFVERIQEIAQENGFDGLYLLAPIENSIRSKPLEESQAKYKLDALMEFHPIAGRIGWNKKQENFVDPSCQSAVYDVDDFVQNRKYLLDTKATVLPGLFPSWDNSPRRYNRGAWILQSTPENYKMWLSDLIRWTRDHNKPEEQFIFVNAWNEWAEGAHLEPDSYYGYAFLQKNREALEESIQDE